MATVLRRWSCLAVAGALAAGCSPTSPGDQAAMGVARLLVRNTGAVATLINKDTACGFASPAVLAAAEVTGTVGGPGTVTLTATGCTLDLGGGITVSGPDCNGTTVTASGKVTVSAKREITGTLTGNATNPVVPASQDATTVTLSKVEFTDFKVTNSSSKNILTIKKGALTAVVMPRLAVAADSGACAVSTPNTGFQDLVVTDKCDVTVEGDNPVVSGVFGTKINAQNGVGSNGDENKISGQIELSSRVAGIILNRQTVHELPVKGDTRGLDPDYNAATFKAGYASGPTCTSNLKIPESFTCADLTPALADGAARLTVKAFGTLASMLDKDALCGFSSDTVKAGAMITGATGGTGTLTLHTQNCTLNVPANTLLPGDCAGVQTRVGGTVRITGSKVLTGRLTGDATTPVVPTTDGPAVITLTITFQDFTLGSSANVNALHVRAGTLTGSLQPRVALASDTAACSISSPIARFNALTYTNADLSVVGAAGTFNLNVTSSALNATSGTWDADTNTLSGTVRVDAHDVTVPSDAQGLDPSFSHTAFDASWQCATAHPTLVMPVSHACAFTSPLAQGIARLTPRTLAAVMALINANATCGFSTPPGTATAPHVDATAAAGHVGVVTQSIAAATPCEITLGLEHPISTDCAGASLRVGGGKIRVSGTKTITGFITGDPVTPVVPNSPAPAVFDLVVEVVAETPVKPFVVRNSAASSSLAMASGRLSGKVTPQTALDSTTGACSIATPVLTFENLTYTGAGLRLTSDGKRFDVAVSTSLLNAQNGTLGAVSNQLTGTLTMDNVAYNVPVPGADNKLDPTFSQAAFDASWQCAPSGGVAPVVVTSAAQCSFLAPLAGGVSRLLVKDLATATSLLNGDTGCGLSANTVLGAGVVAAGTPATWTLTSTACGPTLPAAIPSCITGVETAVEGTFTATATKVVTGTATGLSLPNPPVIPVTPTAANINVTALTLTNFAAFDRVGGVSGSKLILNGTGLVQLSPVAGQSIAASASFMTPVYSKSTPVAGFTGLSFTGTATLIQAVPLGAPAGSMPRTFTVTVGGGDIQGFVGSYTGSTVSNQISGTLTVEGALQTLTAAPLDPSYNQATFDQSYWGLPAFPTASTCNPDLTAPVTPHS